MSPEAAHWLALAEPCRVSLGPTVPIDAVGPQRCLGAPYPIGSPS